jgi:hypothetical protein
MRVGNMMVMHANRKDFYEHEQLVAYPSLDRLAFMLGLNEKTVRRARNKLVELGLIDVAHRYNNSNYYFLRIPTVAREHSDVCIDLLCSPRHRVSKTVKSDDAQMSDFTTEGCDGPESGCTQMSGGVDNYAPEHDVNVQLPTEDSLTYPPSAFGGGCEDKKEERKESTEKEGQGREERDSLSDNPLSSETPLAPESPPAKPKPTMQELRMRLNMPDLGKSVRRMNFINRGADNE